MTWLDSLDVSIADALNRFPDQLNVASIKLGPQTYLVSHQSLVEMARMHLESLPISTIALPYDLTDILTRPHSEKLVRDYSHHLSDYFPNYFVVAIYELQSLFSSKGIDAYIIGGITRDMLLSSERRFDIQDVDIIVEGKALDAARYVNETSRNFDLVQEFAAFGTAKLSYKNQIQIDFASTRKEIYTGCGLLPEVMQVGVPLEEDIIRRDFTVNALALSILHPGSVIDCAGGLQDLEARKIRLLKAHSFFEDPSRILRALRFALRLDFEWGKDTLILLEQFLRHMPSIYKGGGDRIRDELNRLLILPESPLKVRWLEVFAQKGLHRLIDTTLPVTLDLPLPLETVSQRIQALQNHLGNLWNDTLTWEVYMSLIFLSLPETQAEAAMNRLGLTRHEIEVVEKSFRLLHENIVCPLSTEECASRLYDVFYPIPMSTALVGLILSPQFEICAQAYLKYKHDLEQVKLEVTGDDILKLGVPQGEYVGQLLKSLLYAKLEGQVHHRLEEMGWLKTRLATKSEESLERHE